MEENHKLLFREICFEITRKCNMTCRHCMRGEPQDRTITEEVIDRFLDNIAVAGRMEMGYVEFVSRWEHPDQNKTIMLTAKTEWHETTVHVMVADIQNDERSRLSYDGVFSLQKNGTEL